MRKMRLARTAYLLDIAFLSLCRVASMRWLIMLVLRGIQRQKFLGVARMVHQAPCGAMSRHAKNSVQFRQGQDRFVRYDPLQYQQFDRGL